METIADKQHKQKEKKMKETMHIELNSYSAESLEKIYGLYNEGLEDLLKRKSEGEENLDLAIHSQRSKILGFDMALTYFWLKFVKGENGYTLKKIGE